MQVWSVPKKKKKKTTHGWYSSGLSVTVDKKVLMTNYLQSKVGQGSGYIIKLLRPIVLKVL